MIPKGDLSGKLQQPKLQLGRLNLGVRQVFPRRDEGRDESQPRVRRICTQSNKTLLMWTAVLLLQELETPEAAPSWHFCSGTRHRLGEMSELLDAGKTSHGQEEKRRRCLSTRSALLCSLIFGWAPQPRDGSSKIPSPQGQPAGTLPWPSCSHPMAEAFPTPAAGNNSGQCKQKQDTAPLTTALT